MAGRMVWVRPVEAGREMVGRRGKNRVVGEARMGTSGLAEASRLDRRGEFRIGVSHG